jgi:hypothetical protein
MPEFKVGDDVQMQDNSSLWSQHPTLRLARGRVTGTAPDDTERDRISVEFPDGTRLSGVEARAFKRAGT